MNKELKTEGAESPMEGTANERLAQLIEAARQVDALEAALTEVTKPYADQMAALSEKMTDDEELQVTKAALAGAEARLGAVKADMADDWPFDGKQAKLEAWVVDRKTTQAARPRFGLEDTLLQHISLHAAEGAPRPYKVTWNSNKLLKAKDGGLVPAGLLEVTEEHHIAITRPKGVGQ